MTALHPSPGRGGGTWKIPQNELPKIPQSIPPIAYPSDPPSPAIIVNVDRPMAWSSEKRAKS